jgi:UDP-4-amino-4,6-dideoxy-N-acetyl-beta-L-altrosamine N-acetyltransferase
MPYYRNMNIDLHSDFSIGGISLTNFINLTDDQRATVLKWRNNELVRNTISGNTKTISYTEHCDFIERLESTGDRAYFMVSASEFPYGVICLLNIDFFNKRALWGDYANPQLFSRGAGVILEYSAMHLAFDVFSLHCLRCETSMHNKSALRLHDFFGFIQEGILRDYFYNKKDDHYQDVVLMSINSNTWTANRDKVDKIVTTLL